VSLTVAAPGTWLLFVGPDGRQLVQIGQTPVGPVSARKIVSVPLRFGLLPAVTQAFSVTQNDGSVESVAQGQEWDAHVRTIRSPYTNTIVAVQGILMPRGEAPPAAPLVGAWEWIIQRDAEGRPSTDRTTYWDRNLFELYEVSPGADERTKGCWEVPTWANELVAPADQTRVMSSIRDGIRQNLDGVHTLTYEVRTGLGTDSRGTKQLRLMGRIAPDAPEGVLSLQGVSYEVDHKFTEPAFEREGARVDDVLRGTLQLVQEPMCLVDADTLEILATSRQWKRQGFGRASSLAEVFDDRSESLEGFITEAANTTETCVFPRPLSLHTASGEVKEVTVSACGVRREDACSRDALVSLST